MANNQDIVPSETKNKAISLLDKLVSSVKVLVEDITALEVNTMVVDKISASKFNAWEAYQEIYSINDQEYFTEKGIPDDDNLRNRYKSLFAQLEKEYFYILLETDEKNPKVQQYYKRLEYLKKSNRVAQEQTIEADPKHLELARPILPAPSPIVDQQEEQEDNWDQRRVEIQFMLKNDKFVRTLRKMAELKAALNGANIHSPDIDVIYVQTVMQLDGDIITRYHKDLFTLSQDAKDLIVKAHNEGVISGEKQWRGTLSFLIDLIKSIAK